MDKTQSCEDWNTGSIPVGANNLHYTALDDPFV